MSYYSKIQLKDILEGVNSYFGLDISNEGRKRKCVMARHIYCFLSRKYTDRTSTVIGRKINRDHSTVLHSIQVYYKDEHLLKHHTQAITDKLGLTNLEYRCVIG